MFSCKLLVSSTTLLTYLVENLTIPSVHDEVESLPYNNFTFDPGTNAHHGAIERREIWRFKR